MKRVALVTSIAGILLGSLANAQGVISTVAGSTWVFPGNIATATAAPLGQMGSVVVDAQGNFYAADGGNSIVIMLAPAGAMTIVADNGIAGFSGDGGPAAAASLNLASVSGIAVDSAGNLFIGEDGKGCL